MVQRGYLKRWGRIFFFGIVFSFATSWAQERIVHFPVSSAQEGRDIKITARVESSLSRVGFMRIYYRRHEQESYRYVEMTPGINQWVGVIPGKDVRGERLQYFLSAYLTSQTIITYPATDPYNQPEEITIVPAPKGKVAPVPEQAQPGVGEAMPKAAPGPEEPAGESPFLILTPDKNEELMAKDVIIAVSFPQGENAVDSSTVQLFLDGVDVTGKSDISTYLVSYQPGKLQPGSHWFKVTAKDLGGNMLTPVIGRFKVIGEEQQGGAAHEFHAHVFTDLRQETISQKNESFAMGGTEFNGRYGAVEYNGRLFFTSLEDKHYQPRNRYHFSLRTKWLGITGGDAFPRFNDLILWGKRVRGVSGFVRLGFFNVDVVYGETYRGVEGTVRPVTDASGNVLQTVAGSDSLQIASYGTFRQKLIAIRPSFGSGRRFQLGFSFVKAKDDTNSIKYGIMPKDNLVVGPDLKISFDRGRFVILAAGAFSLLTNNIYAGPLSQDDINSLFGENVDVPADPADFEKWLIINDSTTPLDPRKLTSLAYNVSVKLNYYRNLLRVGYKSIGSEYISLANSWIRKDIQGFYFSDRIRLFQNKLYLTLGYEDYLDNFSRNNANPSVSLKTFNYAISYYPGTGLPHVSISMRDHRRGNDVNSVEEKILNDGVRTDTVYTDRREDLVNRDLSVQVGYDINLFNQRHTLNLGYITANRIDNLSGVRQQDTYSSQELSSDIRMITWNTSYNIPLKTSLSYASNKNLSVGGKSDFTYNMFGLGAEYSVFEGRLSTFGEFRLTSANGRTLSNDKIEYSRSHFRFGAMYWIAPRHSISLDANFLTLNDKSIIGGEKKPSYTDSIIRLRYEKFF